jgi:hypothetical protein
MPRLWIRSKNQMHMPPISIDPDILTKVAQQSLGNPSLELLDWSAAALSHEKVIETTGGLFCFRGSGWDGTEKRQWSAVLKVVEQPGQGCQQPQELCYWRRELLAYQSGLLSDLPGGVRPPRGYGVSEQEKGGWIWLENVQETAPSTWTLDHFERAARHLGQLAGAYLAGTPLPDYPWLCASLFRSFYADGDWWERFTDPASPNNAWQRPLVQTVFPDPLPRRVRRIWQEKEAFLDALERLPRVFCHNDAHRRNLMLCQGEAGQEELRALDWAFCGLGALGSDLGELVGTSLSYFAIDPLQAEELETAVLQGYLGGLRQAGWEGDERLPRLGYLLSLALYWGGTLPCEVALQQPGETKVDPIRKFGSPLEKLLPGWTQLAEFALDRADVARDWISTVSPKRTSPFSLPGFGREKGRG